MMSRNPYDGNQNPPQNTATSIIPIYDSFPTQEITSDHFVDLGRQRRQALRELEEICYRAETDSTEVKIRQLIRTRLGTPEEDMISHFVFAIASCLNENEAQTFINLEMKLFQQRRLRLHPSQSEFINLAKNLNIPLDIYQGTGSVKSGITYCLPFESALALVRTRETVLVDGIALVEQDQVALLVANEYRRLLEHRMESFRNSLKGSLSSSRKLSSAIGSVRLDAENLEKITSVDNITAKQAPLAIEESAPLCMYLTYSALSQDHHLKHESRLQFGLWLKGIGLPLEEALIFWQRHFLGKVAGDKFQKDYAYNIRHQYGREGKRVNMNPYGCGHLISSTRDPKVTHGCPFNKLSSDTLRPIIDRRIEKRNGAMSAAVRSEVVDSIVKDASNHHCQFACQKLFEATHSGAQLDAAIRHPNAYYVESRNFITSQTGKDNQVGKDSENQVQIHTHDLKGMYRHALAPSSLHNSAVDGGTTTKSTTKLYGTPVKTSTGRSLYTPNRSNQQ